MRHHPNRSLCPAIATALLATCALAGWASTAGAQETHYLQGRVPPPSNALELQLSAGYTQGFGNVFPGHAINDVAGAGLGLTGSLGWRVSPLASIDFEGQYQAFSSENAGIADGLNLNIGATFHGRADRRGDPWVRVGTGYRWVWADTPPANVFGTTGSASFSGWEIVSLRVGYDVRSTSYFAWAPIVGADLQTFVWADKHAFSAVQFATYLYAALQARFDMGFQNTHGFAAKAAAPPTDD